MKRTPFFAAATTTTVAAKMCGNIIAFYFPCRVNEGCAYRMVKTLAPCSAVRAGGLPCRESYAEWCQFCGWEGYGGEDWGVELPARASEGTGQYCPNCLVLYLGVAQRMREEAREGRPDDRRRPREERR